MPLNGPVTPFTSFGAITSNSLVEFRSPEVDDGLGGFEPMAYNYRAAYDPVAEQINTAGTESFEPVTTLVYIDRNGAAAQARLTVGIPADEDFVTDFTTAPARAGDEGDFLAFTNEAAGGLIADQLLFHAPEDGRALQYTSFGLWQIGLDGLEANVGTAHWGAMTPSGTVPTLGTATYLGHLLGTAINTTGTVMTHYEADSMLAADFDAGTVALSSSNTRNLDDGTIAVGFNISNVTAATITDNTFTNGTFYIWGDPMSIGSFDGAFYGPNAAEAGATFAVEYNNGTYFGSVAGGQP